MKHDDIVSEARKRMSRAVEFDRDNRDEALNDLENIAGRQWPRDIKDSREADGRPCLTINRLPQFVRQVTGDLRRLNPAIKVLPDDDDANQEVADVIERLVRQIEYSSGAERIYEGAAESAAMCGMGYWRILTDYEGDDSFNQVIKLEPIRNPFSVYFDPEARNPTRSDASWCFVTQQMSAEDFKAAYPGKTVAEIEGDRETDGLEYWRDKGDVIIAEYFWKEPVEKTIGQTIDGRVIEVTNAAEYVTQKRTVQTHKVMWAKVSGADVLEGPQEFPSRHLPVIAVMGEELHVGESVVRSSVIRFAKDPQRLYNYWRSAQTEMVALQPKAPFLVTPKQIAGLEAIWAAANDTNNPYLPFNPDEKNPGAPQRALPPVPSSGMMQEVLTAADDMKATTGIYDSSLGNASNETSGVAIRQRQMEGDIANSIYADNLAASIEHCGRVIVDMIPRVYDTARTVRVMGDDDREEAVPINGRVMTLEGVQEVNPLNIGRYAVRVTVGPNYTTRRQETAESMIQFVQALPQAGQVAGDLIAKAMDWPDADKLAERLKKLLPPGMVEPETEEEQAAMMQMMQQGQMQQQMQSAMQEAEVRKTLADATESEADAAKAQAEAMQTQLETALQSGQLNAVIQQAVADQVTRALMQMGRF